MSADTPGLAIGQMWFVLPEPDSNVVDLFKIVGVWQRVVGLQLHGGRQPRYYLQKQLRFVEQVPV